MYDQDAFSKWLKIDRIDEKKGYCKLSLLVTQQMCNGFGVAHGAIAFALADSAVAFAANSIGKMALSTENSIDYFLKIELGDVITVETELLEKSTKLIKYIAYVYNQKKEKVAFFKSTLYQSSKEW